MSYLRSCFLVLLQHCYIPFKLFELYDEVTACFHIIGHCQPAIFCWLLEFSSLQRTLDVLYHCISVKLMFDSWCHMDPSSLPGCIYTDSKHQSFTSLWPRSDQHTVRAAACREIGFNIWQAALC